MKVPSIQNESEFDGPSVSVRNGNLAPPRVHCYYVFPSLTGPLVRDSIHEPYSHAASSADLPPPTLKLKHMSSILFVPNIE